MKVEVRGGREMDREGVAAVDRVAWEASATPAELPLDGDWAGEVDPSELTVAVREGEVVAYALVSKHSRLASGRHVGSLRSLAVDPRWRGHGLGRKVLEAALDRAREQGFEKLLLNVLATNVGARGLYAAVGFREVGRVPDHFRIGGGSVTDLLLERALVAAESAEVEWLAGGCHCGAVRFQVGVRRWEALECNCSICSMKGILHLIVQDGDFELLQGEEELSEYRFGTGVARHLFCSKCGIHPFYRPRSHPDGWDVNARCLDNGAVDRFAVVAFDGRHWEDRVQSIR